MPHANRKPTADEVAHAARVIRGAFPRYEPVFGSPSTYGGHRAPRDHTISFRLRDAKGKYHSNVIWIPPPYLAHLSVDDVRELVAQANGKQSRRRK